jgi:hypothetical protein
MKTCATLTRRTGRASTFGSPNRAGRTRSAPAARAGRPQGGAISRAPTSRNHTLTQDTRNPKVYLRSVLANSFSLASEFPCDGRLPAAGLSSSASRCCCPSGCVSTAASLLSAGGGDSSSSSRLTRVVRSAQVPWGAPCRAPIALSGRCRCPPDGACVPGSRAGARRRRSPTAIVYMPSCMFANVCDGD